MNLFVSPHNDDETLFGAFSIMRYNPEVLIVFDSFIQVSRGNVAATAAARRAESIAALREMGIPEHRVHFLALDDRGESTEQVLSYLSEWLDDFEKRHDATGLVFAPAEEGGGHFQHNQVAASVAEVVHPDRRIHYLTYTSDGKSRNNSPVTMTSDMIQRKLRALSCYATQLEIANTRPHFTRDLMEYTL